MAWASGLSVSAGVTLSGLRRKAIAWPVSAVKWREAAQLLRLRMPSHPNRSRRDSPAANPDHDQVRALRERLQSQRNIGITAAQDICAEAVFTSRRAWQQWEHGDRRMHPAFWWCAIHRLA